MDSIDQYFETVKQVIVDQDLEEVIQGGLAARQNIVQLSGGNKEIIVSAILYAAVVGCSNDGQKLNDKEKKMVDTVADFIIDGLGQQAYDAIEKIAEEKDYGIIKMVASLGQEFAMSLLLLILMFMYVDGEGSEDVLKQLRDIFQLNILAAMMQE